MVDQTLSPRGRPIRETCSQCGPFALLLLAGAAAWVGVFMVCARF